MAARGSPLLRAAAVLGALVLVNRVVAGLSERRHPARGRFVDVDGMPVHMLEGGVAGGETIVLLHGNGGMVQDWEASGVFVRLAMRHRVVAFDRPGFGYTPRPRRTIWTAARQAGLIGDAMRKLGLPPAVVVGHSWGCLVALELALQHPEQVARLVLLSGIYYPEARTDVAAMAATATPVIGDILANTVTPVLGRLLKQPLIARLFGPAPVTTRFRQLFPYGLTLRPGQLQAMATDTELMVPAIFALGGRPAGVQVPVAIAAGTGDLVVDCERHSARLHADIPGSTLHRFEGGGHMIHHNEPHAVSRMIAA